MDAAARRNAVFLLSALFVPMSEVPACDDAADVNDDGGLDIADAIYELTALFDLGAGPISAPDACWNHPTDDGLDCGSFSGCP